MKSKEDIFLFIARELNGAKNYNNKQIIKVYSKEWDKSKADLLAYPLNYFYFDFYVYADKPATYNPAAVGKSTLDCVEKYLFENEIEDIYWFNYYYREYCLTFEKPMDRIFKLERFIYKEA